MGIGNDKWGDPSQGMIFSFDLAVDFNEISFIAGSTALTLESTAWGSDTTGQSGTGWTFTSDGTIGSFKFAGAGTYDFSTGNFSTVAKSTAISLYRSSGGSSGIGMSSFEIATVVPEPSSVVLTALGLLAVGVMRRKR